MKKMTEKFKNILFVIVLASALFSTTNIFANDSKPSLKIINEENKILKLVSNDVKHANVTFRFFDEQGINLLSDRITVDNDLSKAYDLSNLPKGIYEVELEDKISLRKYFVIINAENLEILENTIGKIYKPQILLEKHFISFNMLNLAKSDIKLVISNEMGEELFSEKIKDSITIHKRFDLSKLVNGEYTVKVMTKDNFFATTIDLQE